MDTFLAGVLSNSAVATLLALLAFGLGFRIRRPALLHSLWLLVFLKLVTPPIFTTTLGWAASREPGPAPVLHLAPDLRVAAPEEGLPPKPEPSDAAVPILDNRPGKPIPWQQVVLSLGLGGSSAWTLLVLLRLHRFRKLLTCARPAPDWLTDEARALAARMGISRVPPILLLPGALPPMIFAFGRAAQVLIPEELLASVSRDGARSLLAHELAHLRRRDHWIRAIELVVVALYWWLPVVWWARRELRKAEEECCDAWVVWALPEKESDYAQALVQAVSLVSRSPAALPPAASGIGPFGQLKRRISMVMDARTPHRLSTGARSAVIALSLLVPIIPAWAQEKPAVQERKANPAPEPSPSRTMTSPGDPLSAVDETTGNTVRIIDDGRSLECVTRDGKTAWRTMLGAPGKSFRQLSIGAGKVRALEGTRARLFDLMTGREESVKDSVLPPSPPSQSLTDLFGAKSDMPRTNAERDAPRLPTGKIALADASLSRLAIDLRQRDGARPGMRLEARRSGQRIGTIQIVEVLAWGSWAKPEGDLRIDQLQKGDVVTEFPEKEQPPKVAGSEALPAPAPRGDVPWYGQKFEGQDLVDVLKARLEIQKAKLREAEVASQHGQRRLTRVQDLVKLGLASQSELLDGQKEADLCQSQVEVKRAELKEVEVMLRLAEGALRKSDPTKPR